jgi:hypothetical protein
MSRPQEQYDELPNVCGSEEEIASAMRQTQAFLPDSGIDWDRVQSAYAIGLHMHQPMILNPDQPLSCAEEISNLQSMMNHPDTGENHNARIFHGCYKRMGEFIPQLVEEGKQPRVMLDYSGTLLYGMRKMGMEDVFDSLRKITCQSRYRRCVEWLGSAWGHPVAPSTPMQDYRFHVRAWQHYFASLFGPEALSRIRGFSPSEMALPNHPDVAYEFVRILKDCGYRWVLVQEHTVERADNGRSLEYPHRPHRLQVKNSEGQILSMTAIVKTQGSDTKLIGQMQPYYEAKGLGRIELGGQSIPSLVTQISDGENGGVMMNEFPQKYLQVTRENSGSRTPGVHVSEYLEYLDSRGIREEDFPVIQPIFQHRIQQRLGDRTGPEAMEKAIRQLEKEDGRFHVEGGSWTNNISWVKGYEKVLGPMEQASVLFSQKAVNAGIDPSERRFRNALYHLLVTQTSCYRYWGEGAFADYGREFCRRLMEILRHDF